MTTEFLNGQDLQKLIETNTFCDSDAVTDYHMLQFKRLRTSYVKVPSKTNSLIPYDGFVWAKTKRRPDKTIEWRHQPTYKNLDMFGTKVSTKNCTELNHAHIHKQVFTHEGFTYVRYFSSSDDRQIPTPDEITVASKERISKHAMNILKTEILPHRKVADAVKVARRMNLGLTSKQIHNAARSVTNTLVGRTGPKAHTTREMAEEILMKYPHRTWFHVDANNLLEEFTFVRIFEDACQLYLQSCPTQTELRVWQKFVDNILKATPEVRKKALHDLLEIKPSGIYFPSRIYVDTTFNLADLYVSLLLAEVGSFCTKSSSKPRVIPIGYLLHSNKLEDTHRLFATELKNTFELLMDPLDPRSIPCILMDGEPALKEYSEILEAPSVRCDVHVLSLLSHDYGGKAAAEQAKPFLFGRMDNGRWLTGAFGVFHLTDLEKRVSKLEDEIHPRIYSWVTQKKNMIMESISAAAKLRGGHLLQYSSNNAHENFNGIIKLTITRRHSAQQIINKLDLCCSDKLREVWLSGIDGSESVVMLRELEHLDYDDKLAALKEIGFSAPVLLASGIPLKVAEHLDIQKVIEEASRASALKLTSRCLDTMVMEDENVSLDHPKRHAIIKKNGDEFYCWNCKSTLPSFICSHIYFAIGLISPAEQRAHWKHLTPGAVTTQKNALKKSAGHKLSDRIGLKRSAMNFVRQFNDMSTLPVFHSPIVRQSPSSSPSQSNIFVATVHTPTTSSPSAQHFTPSSDLTFSPVQTSTPIDRAEASSVLSESSRRSGRMRQPRRPYSPSNTDDSSI